MEIKVKTKTTAFIRLALRLGQAQPKMFSYLQHPFVWLPFGTRKAAHRETSEYLPNETDPIEINEDSSSFGTFF